jgi:hypothetical protein
MTTITEQNPTPLPPLSSLGEIRWSRTGDHRSSEGLKTADEAVCEILAL